VVAAKDKKHAGSGYFVFQLIKAVFNLLKT